MTPKEIQDLKASSPLAWIDLSGFVTENQRPFEFRNHRFLIDIYADNSPDVVCIKSAQVGFSVYAIMKSLHELKYEKRNILYALPTRNIVQDFVKPKVDPLIYSNPEIQASMGNDSLSQKKFGERFIFFKGGSEREAISVSADTLVIDEYDRMPDMNVVTMFDSRLQATEEPRRRRFSNPSAIGFGVDKLYKDSSRHHWIVECEHCQYRSYMGYSKESYTLDGTVEELVSHYVDKLRAVYACGDCDGIISDAARRAGQWVAFNPGCARHGYWINQMMAPWVTAARIIQQEEDMDIATFHSMVLGKAFTPSDLIVNRENIIRATSPGNIMRSPVSIGVDQDAGGQYYVCMTPQGIFDHGYVDGWEKIEHLKLMYKAVVVCDPNPYPTMPKQLANKYSDWYLCYFKNLDGLSAVQWKEAEQVVYADRTRVIDIRANEIINARLLYRERVSQLEDVIKHWENIYRTTEEKEDGRVKSVWLKKEDKQSDYPFAETYARIGLAQVMGADSTFLEPTSSPTAPVTNLTANGETINVDFRGIINDTYEQMEQ